MITDRETLEKIRDVWFAWAGHNIEAPEALGRIAEALEGADMPVIEGVGVLDDAANDHCPP